MNRQQLAHLLRSACAITNDEDVLVLGSQSILGCFDEDDLPPEATASQEADLGFLNDADRRKADQVEAVIGEMSAFHEQNGVYAEGIHVDTATLPFVDALLRAGMLEVAVIRERAYLLPDGVDGRVRQRVHGWLDYYDGGKGR